MNSTILNKKTPPMNFDDLLPKTPKTPADAVYIYADGSANLYFVTPTFIEYAPMTPERSSSGMYSGGEPAKVPIDESSFSIIEEVIESFTKNTADHIPDRIKMSGNIYFVKEGKSFNLAHNSNSKNGIEAMLKMMLCLP